MLNYLLLATFLSVFLLNNAAEFLKLRNEHLPALLTTPELKYIAGLSNTTQLNVALDNICIPRVVGSSGHDRVHNYIIKEMKNLGWHVDVDTFQEKTPNMGTLTFRNIITTLNPNAERYLLLACHYDSKYFKNFDFEGATDSAVPCAMLINLATVMKKELEPLREDVNLKFFFFDGEEAFENWSPTDSIYGARHLAEVYENKVRLGSGPSHLERIDMLILLDLIGAANPRFFSYFRDTDRWYLKLIDAERRLKKHGLIKSSSTYFVDRQWYSGVEDDHLPFLERGVPVLHLIPSQFPKVWHTINDNRQIVDITTTENMNKILRVFVAEYLHLSVTS
ncbi:glutaminyl-peptide cyclotransferase [Holotrichia oblita]|uniref:Glutaminyl-peptide cyclotransferase n=1 Tax=Holotrichia oblita TaxID=644536 RepID=A0ACB9SR73_HOLOL|nr:glutaminyl-peptide cyclotransferase [Holotrichia oblita]